jgi:hypothetical protein
MKQDKLKMWGIRSPAGRLLPHTFSTGRRKSAQRKLLDAVEQKYTALVNSNFKKWEEQGYQVVKLQVEVIAK